MKMKQKNEESGGADDSSRATACFLWLFPAGLSGISKSVLMRATPMSNDKKTEKQKRRRNKNALARGARNHCFVKSIQQNLKSQKHQLGN